MRGIVESRGDWRVLFGGETEKGDEGGVVERFFPRERRYEVPIIEFEKGESGEEVGEIVEKEEGGEEGSGEGKRGMGTGGFRMKLMVKKLADMEEVEKEKRNENREDEERAVKGREGEFWKKREGSVAGMKGKAENVDVVINQYFPRWYRNMAPVFEFAKGELGVSLKMEKIEGRPEGEEYMKYYEEERMFKGPQIRLKKPMGEWDKKSGFVEVSSEEVQLPMARAAALKERLLQTV